MALPGMHVMSNAGAIARNMLLGSPCPRGMATLAGGDSPNSHG